jgi:phage protein D
MYNSGPSFTIVSDEGRPEQERLVSLSFLAARVASISSHAINGETLEDRQKAVLKAAAKYLDDEAAAIQFADTRGQQGRRPVRFSSPDLAAEMILHTKRESDLPDAEAVKVVKAIARELRRLAKTSDKDLARGIHDLFAQVADAARSTAGSPGHKTTYPEPIAR